MNKIKKALSLIMAFAIISSSVVITSAGAVSTDNTDSDIVVAEKETQDLALTQQETDMAITEATQQVETQAETQAETQQPTQDVSPTVGKVKTIYKDNKSTNEIHIYWKPVDNAEGYFVYMRNSDKSNDFSLITTTPLTEVTIKNLSATTAYQFKVCAYRTDGSQFIEGESAYLETATQPLSIPAMTLKRSSTVISFSYKRDPKADGYAVYRASYRTDGKFKLYKTVKGNTKTTFEDKSVEKGRSYYYQVKAYRTVYPGRTYYGSGTTLKTVAGLGALSVSATSQLRRVSLTWNRNPLATGYMVYYSTSKNSGYKHLKTTALNYFNTVRLTDKKTYYFRVIPYKKNGDTVIRGTYSTFSKMVTSKAYNKTIGNTYIEISLKQQRMWMYINGKLYCETPVVTGNDDGYHNTPKGAHKIWQRKSPATLSGPSWSSYVTYWLAFTYSGCGIHDASWRSSSEYGGTTYKGNGSHGCVNTPYSKAKKIYSKARMGMYVVIY